MPNNYFDDLPAEIKLHVLSFLSTKDSLSLLSTNRINNDIAHDPRFWQSRTRHDFVTGVDEVNAKSEYLKLKSKLSKERQLCAAYLAAYRAVIASSMTIDKKSRRVEELDNALEHLCLDSFMLVAKNFTNGVLGVESLLPDSFDVMRLLDEASYPLISDLSEEHAESIGMMVRSFAKCNAVLSLRKFFNGMSPCQRKDVISKIGAQLLCCAAEFGSVDVVRELLAAGAHPNHYGFYLEENNVTYVVLPLFFLCNLLFKTDRAISRGDAIFEIIHLFAAHEVDVDLLGIKMQALDQPGNEDLPTIRERAVDMQGHITSHSNRYSPDALSGMNEMLQLIISQPSCFVTEADGTNNHNDFEGSTHTNLQRRNL